MNLPKKYQWLNSEPGPRMLVEALKLYGTKEMPGNADSPEILAWAKETGLNRAYSSDAVAWCGLFMAVVAKRADKEFPKDPLWARNWVKFGEAADTPMLGDVLVFTRDGGGHVGIYVGEDDTTWHVLGGNQTDAVTITRLKKNRLLAARRPSWKIAQPSNVRKVFLDASGVVSENEA